MAKQTIVTTTTTRTRSKKTAGATVLHSSPAGKTSIGSKTKGNPYRCPNCGKYMSKQGG